MSNNVRKISKNEILKAMECYDRYPYMPFWWIVKEISENGYGIERLNYEFKYGYGHPDRGHFHQSYSPSKELKDIYRYMENYIDNKNYNRPHNTSLNMQDYSKAYSQYGEHSFLNFTDYVNRNNFEQALKERDYWRGARGFIDRYIPKEIDTYTQQENNIHYARRFGRKAYKYVGDIIAQNGMSSSDPRAIAMHGTIGGMIAKMCGRDYIQGEVLGEINKEIVAQIYKNKKTIGFSDRDVINFSRQLGEHLGISLGLGSNLGGEIAEMATRWNQTGEHNTAYVSPLKAGLLKLQERAKGLDYNQIAVVSVSLGRVTVGLAMDRNSNVYTMGNFAVISSRLKLSGDGGVFTIPNVDQNDPNGVKNTLPKGVDFNASAVVGNTKVGVSGSLGRSGISVNKGGSIGYGIGPKDKPFDIEASVGTAFHIGQYKGQEMGEIFKDTYNEAQVKYMQDNPNDDYKVYRHPNGSTVLVRKRNGINQIWSTRAGDPWINSPRMTDTEIQNSNWYLLH